MSAHRWCEKCGIGLTRQQWIEANFCRMCGAQIQKDTGGMPGLGLIGKLESMVPVSAARHLQAIQSAIVEHPVASALGAVGVGAAGIAVFPLLLVAGQSIMVLGGIVAGVSGYLDSKSYDDEYAGGVRLGLQAVAVGALVYGSGYVLLGAGGLAVVGGVGLGGYAGVKAIMGRRSKQIITKVPLLLEG